MLTIDGISTSKFHPVYGGILKVALESHLPADLVFLPITEPLLYDKRLIHKARTATKIYFPAVVSGDISQGDIQSIVSFVPWVDEKAIGAENSNHVLVFRLSDDNPRVKVTMARLEEEKPFGFDPTKPPYIWLDFFSRRRNEFLPLFIKVDDGSAIVYIKLEAGADEGRAILFMKTVNEAEVPEHLKKT